MRKKVKDVIVDAINTRFQKLKDMLDKKNRQLVDSVIK